MRWGYYKFCQWGVKKVVEFEKPYKGGPTPLWGNVSERWFMVLSNISLVFFFTVFVEYVII